MTTQMQLSRDPDVDRVMEQARPTSEPLEPDKPSGSPSEAAPDAGEAPLPQGPNGEKSVLQKLLEVDKFKGLLPVVDGQIVPQDYEGQWRLAALLAAAKLNRGSNKSPLYYTTAQWAVLVISGFGAGLKFMQIVNGMTLINDKPCIYGDAAHGLILAHPRCHKVEEWTEGEGKDAVAYCRAIRRIRTDRNDPAFYTDLAQVERSFSYSQAARARLIDKEGPWKYGFDWRMLQMRARAYAERDAFADVLGGLAIAEEQADIARQNAFDPDQMAVAQQGQSLADRTAAVRSRLTGGDAPGASAPAQT